MPNWAESMQQTFEYYVVDPGTWKDKTKLNCVKSCTINRDLETDTLGSATIDVTEPMDECYVRVYLVTIQNGIREKHPLGTFLVQTPATSFDGKVQTVSLDAYTPLIELKENRPPLGYTAPRATYNEVIKDPWYKDTGDVVPVPPITFSEVVGAVTTNTGKQVFSYRNADGVESYLCLSGANMVMDLAYMLVQDQARAPKVKPNCTTPLNYNFVADPGDTWFSFLNDLIASANYRFDLDDMGRILFAPYQDMYSLQPVWTYDDGNSSILYPEIGVDRDLYGIPNVVEVIYFDGANVHYAKAENDDPTSPTSIQKRGRRIVHRVTDPDLPGIPKKDDPIVKDYANRLLKELSTVEYTVSYTHGYCPTRIGDCVRLNYARSGLTNVKAKIVSQSIKCEPGCPVTEKAIFTTKLWG